MMDIVYRINSQKDILIFTHKAVENHDLSFSVSLNSFVDDLHDFLKIMKVTNPIEGWLYKSLVDVLGITNEELIISVPSPQRIDLFKKITETLKSCLCDKSNEIYVQSYIKQKRMLRKLQRPLISKVLVDNLARKIEHEHIARKVKDLGVSTERTEYSMSGTATGRMTVVGGPNILTLPSEVRKAIVPKTKQGVILQMDLIAAEPQLALLEASRCVPDDIYTHLASTVLQGRVTRKQAKLITLSALYGQSAGNLSRSLPSNINPHLVIKKTKDFFCAEDLYIRLVRSLKNGDFRNILGRPLFLEQDRRDLVVSYFLQSSIAELSVLIFDRFIDEHDNVIPYYVIHDALIFECDTNLADDLTQRKEFNVALGTWKFKAKVTRLKDS